MKRLFLTLLGINPFLTPGFTQTIFRQEFGDFPILCDTAGLSKAVTSGYHQPNLWKNPPMHDTVLSEEETFVFDLHEPESFYAPFFFDVPTATKSGWYRYRILQPYFNQERTDSVFVAFLSEHDDNGDTIDPGTGHEPVSPPRIVNLIVLDVHGFSRFRILNRQDYDQVELTLFDLQGKAIYCNSNYLNDYDFASKKPGTYYYRVVLHTPRTRIRQDGFVEVIQKAQ